MVVEALLEPPLLGEPTVRYGSVADVLNQTRALHERAPLRRVVTAAWRAKNEHAPAAWTLSVGGSVVALDAPGTPSADEIARASRAVSVAAAAACDVFAGDLTLPWMRALVPEWNRVAARLGAQVDAVRPHLSCSRAGATAEVGVVARGSEPCTLLVGFANGPGETGERWLAGALASIAAVAPALCAQVGGTLAADTPGLLLHEGLVCLPLAGIVAEARVLTDWVERGIALARDTHAAQRSPYR